MLLTIQVNSNPHFQPLKLVWHLCVCDQIWLICVCSAVKHVGGDMFDSVPTGQAIFMKVWQWVSAVGEFPVKIEI